MTEFAESASGGEVSLIRIATAALKRRWSILGWTMLGGVVAAALVWGRPALYVASASFVPQGADASRSNLASLAGQFGVSIPTSSQGATPDFYVRLIRSRELLTGIARDTFNVPEAGGRRTLLDLLDIKSTGPLAEDAAVSLLSRMIVAPTPSKQTGIVDVSVSSKWPSLSLAIVSDLLRGVNDYNHVTRQGQATAERKFVESQRAIAAGDLRTIEDSLQRFLSTNRQGIGTSPELTFEHQRLERDLGLKQQVFSSLTQAYEDARIREVRDVPVTTIVESPWVSPKPLPRGRGIRILLGMILGALAGALPAIGADLARDQSRKQNPDLDAFREVLGDIAHPIRRRGRRRQVELQ